MEAAAADSWLHDSLGKDRVAMLASMGVLEEVENSVLPIITDDSYEYQNECFPLGHGWTR